MFVATAIFPLRTHAQRAVDVARPEEKAREEKQEKKQLERRAQAGNVEINGATAFSDKELRSELREQIASIDELGLTPARADDAAFLLEIFYRKQGFPKVEVRYVIAGNNRLRLNISEGRRVTLSDVNFVGNANLASGKLREYAIGPTQERYSKADPNLPFVPSDIEEGVDLVRRLYISEGFLDVVVEAPQYRYRDGGSRVAATIAINEGRRYSFGDISFVGRTAFRRGVLLEEIGDLLQEPYTERRLADIPRRLQAYYRDRGYFDVKVEATGQPTAARKGRVPVQVTIASGEVYHFDGVTVSGTQRLRPSYITRRFTNLSGKTYNPDVLDEKFRDLMRTGLFNVLQIRPKKVDENTLRLEIDLEEAKSKEFGFSIGYGSYAGFIVGASYRDRNLFGYGQPLSTSAEYSQRGYKGEILWEDPYLFDTENRLKVRISALTFEFDGYTKFELGGRIDLTRKFTKQYEVGAVIMARHVEITSADIDPVFLGRTSYQVNSIGYTQTLDLRKSPFVSPRGLVIDNTLDVASDVFGSQIDFIRSTARISYYLPFKTEEKTVKVAQEGDEGGFGRWFRESSLAFGARAGVIRSLGGEGIPIDERFFNGGSTTVRSFVERDLGPHDGGDPIGGEFFTVFNVEYTFPIYGELQGAVFVDAGNLLPDAKAAGLNDMRYALGVGLRYKLPIGPVRLDYGVNPNPRAEEDFGAFHFSFGFAF
ncbi:MAG: BamA/TamA family outer membrane protein [Chthoniobacterales bacterium]|nr:BamA/TamA family outer membrane protein [Chthoniobacterales bacterium]